MKKGAVIGSIGIIIIAIIIISFNSEEITTEEIITTEENWNGEGRIQIDKEEYLLGEKVFVNILDLEPDEKGKLHVFRPLNSTHDTEYMTISYDGSKSSTQYKYFQPRLFEYYKICTVDDIVGEWRIEMKEMGESDIYFEVLNDYLIDEEDHMWDVEKKRWDNKC